MIKNKKKYIIFGKKVKIMKWKQKYGGNDVICKENKKRQHVSWLN